jgi:hypothetical protein
MKVRVLMVALLALVAVNIAYGADVVVKAQIPFQFTANGRVLPAGEYAFSIDYLSAIVMVRSEAKRTEIAVPFLTTMAQPAHSTASDSDVVFDKVGDKCTLSEIWTPGNVGVLVFATKGKHEHQIVHSSTGTD